jgi:cell division protein FtsL
MKRGHFFILLLLVLAVLLTATGVVYAKYASRRHFVELEQLRAERDRSNVEWGRLQLEQSAWGTHSRVERIARQQLGMRLPSNSEVVVIRQ